MDPICVIATAGAVANIIHMVVQTIGSLRDLHDCWRGADLTTINLIAQLTALKAALRQIQEWLENNVTDTTQHHQLIVDLEVSLQCVRMLITRMEEQISGLVRNADNKLELGSKIRITLCSKTIKDFQKYIKRQTGALTLLLTAFNSYALNPSISSFPSSKQRLVKQFQNRRHCSMLEASVKCSTK
ncbi:hypothetical protein K469DRAFT_678160 [Zopfia rhizophila CBS 207.26]|uniref:Fungal N-terminal domain-containing protein n=1 Tax=Zopfia rhizophila CBS 207.26 TaxID=1314779 RepID=A0A6A6DE61_9PEZI|nr:hypothetical protein K469DRAFT_678160 [Zopfia rhizophila CBS 207.26]